MKGKILVSHAKKTLPLYVFHTSKPVMSHSSQIQPKMFMLCLRTHFHTGMYKHINTAQQLSYVFNSLDVYFATGLK